MKFLNYTPHPINFYKDGELVFSLPSVGSVRLEEIDSDTTTMVNDDHHAGVQVCIREYGDGQLPPYQNNVCYIVSNLVASAFPNRHDLYYPAADVRDGEGRIIGTTKLCQVPLP